MGQTTKMEQVEVASLRPYERNAKLHPRDQIEKLKRSIEEFGFLSPCLIDKDGNIIAGHGRVQAAKELGLQTVPCVYVEGLTEEQRRAYIIADNRLTELGGWDMSTLEEEMDALEEAGFDATLTGFDWDRATELDKIEEDEYDPQGEHAAELEPRTKRGDIFLLGDHRLMCGDSTSKEDMDRLMVGELADLVFTDPPYGVAVGDKNQKLKESGLSSGITENIMNDTLEQDDLRDLLTRAFTNLREHAEDFCSYYVASPAGSNLIVMLEMMRDAGLEVRHTLAWVKNASAFGLLGLDYKYRHEIILYTWTGSHRFRGGYDQTVIDENQNLEKMEKPELKELIHALKGDGETTAIYCDKPLRSPLHPTTKPVRLVSRFIYNSSEPGDRVVDIFGGSGTTLIAAEQLGRRCFMMELDPHYCDVIIDRWEEFTGRKAKKI